MTFGRWLLGVALLAAIVASLALGARAVRRRFAPELDGPTAVLADAILALSALVVLAELLGVVGLLDAIPVVVGAAALGAGGVALGRRGIGGGAERAASAGSGAGGGAERPAPAGSGAGGGAERPDSEGRGAGGVVRWVSFAGAALVFAAWTRRTLVSLDLGVGGVDSLWYHLPFAAHFAQTGSTTSVPYVDLEFLTAFYPANSELLHATGFVLFGTAALAPLLSLAALALAILAGWCVGRPWDVAPATLLATALVLGVPALFESQAGEAKNDVAALAFLLAAVAFVGERKGGRATLALAGAAAGLAVGTKLSLLAPVGALFLAVAFMRRKEALPFAVAALTTGGFWYLRNLFATGNPLPWLGPLPQPEEARSADTATTLAEYFFSQRAWSDFFLPVLDDVLGPAWPVLVGLAALGAILALVKGPRWIAFVAIVGALAYVVTPSSAAGPPDEPIGFGLNVRYATPALLLGLCLVPIVLRRQAAIVAGAFAVLLLVTQLAPDVIWADEHRRKAIVLGVIALGMAAVAARTNAKAVVAAAVVVGAAALWPLERDFLRQQYTGALQPYTSWQAFGLQPVYAWAREQEGARIAVTGTTGAFFQYPLHGPELDNEVELIGVHGPHGSFTPVQSCEELAFELEGQTHAVVTPHLDIWDPYRPLEAPELACLRMSGAREVLTSGRIHVFALAPR